MSEEDQETLGSSKTSPKVPKDKIGNTHRMYTKNT
ncbi:uncharacterized protein G2W53_041436 [Senna tora]|uniref:Uncharacterized protein n=1 Tax=Senna tora TaxID=362788 RepID=A0A834VZ64_9FABA|nr:uncharacterized protein G2W53_041436 [Senna tora]